ncbi:MAG: glycosyltransferase, partial [Schleiferiaceae bacterium]|nr:glycosyltransferase [Schleiferiaceae bacterium]
WCWKQVESYGIPRADAHVTVNASIANQYLKEYGQSFDVIRNVPLLPNAGLPFSMEGNADQSSLHQKTARQALSLPEDGVIWLMQGAGINMERGAEELAEAASLDGSVVLLFVGSGDALPALKLLYADHDNIRFIDRVNLATLKQYGQAADLGFSLDKPLSKNYQWSLPNKLFDYFQSGLPVIVSDLKEVASVVRSSQAGVVVEDVNPQAILAAARQAMANHISLSLASRKAAHVYHWGKESLGWDAIIDRIEGKSTLHVWSMDRLEAPLYGGTVEVSGQIRMAQASGLQVVLHAWGQLPNSKPFDQGITLQSMQRQSVPLLGRLNLPWIVSSRKSSIANHRAQVQRGMVLVNGPHCTGPAHPKQAILRLHNPESAYYASLARSVTGWQRWHHQLESYRLKAYEKQLASRWQGDVWAISSGDANLWTSDRRMLVIPPLADMKLAVKPCEALPDQPVLLVHGKFSVDENRSAVLAVIQRAESLMRYDVQVMGHGLDVSLVESLVGIPHMTYVDSPSDAELHKALSTAHVVLVHANHALGVKLKLLHGMVRGGHVLAHALAIKGLPYTDSCHAYGDWQDALRQLDVLAVQVWDSEAVDQRSKDLQQIAAMQQIAMQAFKGCVAP